MKLAATIVSKKLCYLILIVSIFSSCRKHEVKTVLTPIETLANLKDSASYVIDGKRYICDHMDLFGRGNRKANRDIITGQWDADTTLYFAEYGLGKNSDQDRSDDGYIGLFIIKKYHRTQMMASSSIPSLMQPRHVSDHYAPGNYSYVSDFEQNNSQNGVKLSFKMVNGNESEMLSTQVLNANPPNNQNNIFFKINRFEAVPNNDGYLLEGKFNAVAYDKDGQPKIIEDGFLRIRVR